jgi:dihydroflavonol-4-reductase
MRVLITGATGFIGSHLTEELHKKGYEIRCIIRKSSNLQWIKHLPIEYIDVDYKDKKTLQKAIENVDVVYHAAGVTKSKTKLGYFEGNHIPTKNLLEAILETDINISRFVHISSQAAVGPSLDGKPIDENTPFHPITTYGISKMEAEKECLKLMNQLPITIVRPPAVYGPRDRDVFAFFDTMNKGIQPMIGFRDTYVSLVHVKDLVNGIILCGENKNAIGKTYFISSERYYNWKELGDLTSEVLNKKVIRVHVPNAVVYSIAALSEFFALFSSKPALLNIEKAKDITQRYWTCSIEKAKKELGYSETLTIREGIENTIEWYKSNGWLR